MPPRPGSANVWPFDVRIRDVALGPASVTKAPLAYRQMRWPRLCECARDVLADTKLINDCFATTADYSHERRTGFVVRLVANQEFAAVMVSRRNLVSCWFKTSYLSHLGIVFQG